MSDIEATDKFRQTDKFVMAHVGGEIVLAPISASTADMGKVTSVNSTGASILDSLMAGNDISATVDALVERFGEENRDALNRDVRNFASKMLIQGVIQKVV